MSKILAQLYVGSFQEAMNREWLKSHHVSHVVNCSKEHDDYFPDMFNYLSLNLLDSPQQSIYGVLEKTYRFMLDAIGNGGTVFVHCHAGISRSVSMVCYFLMKSQKWNYLTALDYVQKRRPQAYPNQGFARQLVSVSPEARAVQNRLQTSVAASPPGNAFSPGSDMRRHPFEVLPTSPLNPRDPSLQAIDLRSQVLRTGQSHPMNRDTLRKGPAPPAEVEVEPSYRSQHPLPGSSTVKEAGPAKNGGYAQIDRLASHSSLHTIDGGH